MGADSSRHVGAGLKPARLSRVVAVLGRFETCPYDTIVPPVGAIHESPISASTRANVVARFIAPNRVTHIAGRDESRPYDIMVPPVGAIHESPIHDAPTTRSNITTSDMRAIHESPLQKNLRGLGDGG